MLCPVGAVIGGLIVGGISDITPNERTALAREIAADMFRRPLTAVVSLIIGEVRTDLTKTRAVRHSCETSAVTQERNEPGGT